MFSKSFVLTILVVGGLAGAPIPPKTDGFFYKRPFTCKSSDVTQLSAYYDLVCPDSRSSWPGVKAAAQFYGSDLQVRVHTFPLPYHRNALLANQAGQAIAAQLESDFFVWMEAVYAEQESYGNVITTNKTEVEVKEMLASLAQKTLNIEPAKTMGWLDYTSPYDEATRVSWKFGCSKAVSGTPTIFVNGVVVDADPTWNLTQWRKLLDPIIHPSKKP